MIKCEKCGKIYDYEKTYGICPKCARYNRKEGNVTTERELHRKYDSNPWAHMADESHRETHRVNQDTYRHGKDEYASSHRTYSGAYAARQRKRSARSGRRRKKAAGSVSGIFWVIVTILVILCAGGSIIAEIRENSDFDRVSSALENLTDLFPGGGTENDSDGEPARENEIYADSVWATYIGRDLSDPDWRSTLIVSEEELEELEKLVLPDDEAYYLVTAYVKNNTAADYDLKQAQFEFYAEGDRKIPCQKVFDNNLSVAEADGSGYIDCLIAVPLYMEKAEGTCTLNGQAEPFQLYFYHNTESEEEK